MKMSIRNTSIKNKIYLSNVLILLISLSVFAFFANKISKQAIVGKATKNSIRELSLINNSLENLTNSVDDYSRILSLDYRLQQKLELIKNARLDPLSSLDFEKVLSKVISNVVYPATMLSAASIMGTDKTLYEVGYANNASVRSEFNDKLIKRIQYIKTPVWTSLFRLRYRYGGSENAFGIAKIITDFDSGRYLGIAILYLNEEKIASVYLNNRTNKNDRFYLLDGNNHIISSGLKSDLYHNFNTHISLGSLKLTDFSNDESRITHINGKQSLVSVKVFDKLGWKIISIVPLDEITMENKQITRLILIIGALCLIFAFITAYIVSVTITKPILNMAGIMHSIKQGNMELRAKAYSTDEIGQLGEGFNNLMERIQELMHQIYNEQKWKRESDFKLLQSQIKPHFLYNTLETIIAFIKLDLKDNAIRTTKALAAFYRTSLNKGNDIITIGDEVQLNENYLSIQKFRYMEYLDYKLEFDEAILHYNIPKLTLQPLIENAIYHGIKEKQEKGFLSIKGYLDNDRIKIEVLDNGVGMDQETIDQLLHPNNQMEHPVSFGVNNVNARLKLLYGECYGLTIESKKNNYTKVTVLLPVTVAQGG